MYEYRLKEKDNPYQYWDNTIIFIKKDFSRRIDAVKFAKDLAKEHDNDVVRMNEVGSLQGQYFFKRSEDIELDDSLRNILYKTELEVKESDLLAMVRAFRKYRKLVEPIAKDQPAFAALIDQAMRIEAGILNLNRMIHRKYDGLTMETYMKQIESTIL